MVMQLLSQLGQGQGGPQDQPDQGGGGGQDPLAATQDVIQSLHDLIAVLPDPGMSHIAATCLANVMKIQTQLMGAQQQSQTAGQQLAQNIGGQGGQGGY